MSSVESLQLSAPSTFLTHDAAGHEFVKY